MTADMLSNGTRTPRRSLNDSIGRLDKMIDGLSEAIPGTIRDTLQESVGVAITEGVRVALVEILSSPEVLAVLRNPVASASNSDKPATPRFLFMQSAVAWAGASIGKAAQWCQDKVKAAANAAVEAGFRAVAAVASLRQRLWALRTIHKPILIALVIGGLAATAALFAPNWLAATLSGIGGACVTMAIQVWLWVRQSFQSLTAACD
jgi:hypothetical protein